MLYVQKLLHDFLRLKAADAATSKKKGPSCPGMNVDGIILYFPGTTFSSSKARNPHLGDKKALALKLFCCFRIPPIGPVLIL